jgi:predicted secreted protein
VSLLLFPFVEDTDQREHAFSVTTTPMTVTATMRELNIDQLILYFLERTPNPILQSAHVDLPSQIEREVRVK